jgi:ABC-type lipoprotein release transport system permease subunit
VGVFDAELESTEKSFVFLGRAVLQQILGIEGAVSEIAVSVRNRDELDGIMALLRTHFPGLSVDPWTTLEPFVLALVKVQSGFLYIWYGVVIVTISFGLINTLFMIIFERTREIGLLQALGMYPWQIVLQVLFESVVLLFSGAVVGNVLTFLLLAYFSGGIDLGRFSEGTELFGVGHMIHLHLQVSDWLVANALVAALGTLASIYPAWRAGKLLPAQAFSRG